MEDLPNKKKDLANIINYNKNGKKPVDIFAVLEFLQCVKYQKLFSNYAPPTEEDFTFEEKVVKRQR